MTGVDWASPTNFGSLLNRQGAMNAKQGKSSRLPQAGGFQKKAQKKMCTREFAEDRPAIAVHIFFRAFF